MATVKFNDPNEFVEEIARDASKVEGKILRVTTSQRRGGGLPLVGLAVIATAVVRGHVVRLDRFCGEYMMPGSPEAEKVRTECNRIADGIRAKAGEMGLECRPGVFED